MPLLPFVALLLAAEPAKLPFAYPIYVAADSSGTVVVADQGRPALFRIAPDGTANTLFEGPQRFKRPLYRPRGLALLPEGAVAVCDPATMDVYHVSAGGDLTPRTGVPVTLLDGGKSTIGKIVQPEGVTVDDAGNWYVSDLRRDILFIVEPSGELTECVPLEAPRGLARTAEGKIVAVCGRGDALRLVDPATKKVTSLVEGRGPMQFPLSVAVRADGRFAVADSYAKTIWLVDAAGAIEPLVSGPPLDNPTGVAALADGRLVVADPRARTVFVVSPEGSLTPLAVAAE